MEERYCSNCRALIPTGNDACPACGVYAGDVFDGKVRASSARRPASRMSIVVTLLILGAAAAGGWWWWTRYGQIPKPDTGPIRVVGDRPGGGSRSEAEAVLTLRHFLATDRRSECIAVISRGYRSGDYSFDVVDSCQHTKLGRWRVNAKTRAVSQ
jgi:hypothetical protein